MLLVQSCKCASVCCHQSCQTGFLCSKWVGCVKFTHLKFHTFQDQATFWKDVKRLKEDVSKGLFRQDMRAECKSCHALRKKRRENKRAEWWQKEEWWHQPFQETGGDFCVPQSTAATTTALKWRTSITITLNLRDQTCILIFPSKKFFLKMLVIQTSYLIHTRQQM